MLEARIKNPLESTFFEAKNENWSNEPVFRFYKKKSIMLPPVVWAEESKNGIKFEIEPSYDVVPTRSLLVTDGQSSLSWI